MYAIANIRLTEVPAAADPTPYSRRVSGKGVDVSLRESEGFESMLRSRASWR